MKYNFKLNTISAGVLASLMALPLIAQEAETANTQTDDDIEVIEVSGFKSSLQKAMNAKRFADTVTDSIHAEDVGKSTDQNIADALSRVTGVTVQEEAGEGTRISIRGAGPSLNQISVNGVALTGGLSTDGSNAGATNDNSVDLSSFSSDILSSIDVVKTAAADQDEGSLGGSVTLRTVQPLDLKKSRRSFTIEGRYNEFSDETDSRMNFSFSDKFMDEKLGFIITASKDNQKTRQDRISTDWSEGVLPIADWEANSGRKATDLATGQPIRVLNYLRDDEGGYMLDEGGNRVTESIDTLTNYDASSQTLHEGDLYVAAREIVDFGLNTDERERLSVSTGIQYRPTDNLDIQLDLTHTEQDIFQDNQLLRMNIAPVNQLLADTDVNVVDRSTNTLEKSFGRAITGGFLRNNGLREVDTDVASLRIDYSINDDLNMKVLAGYSRTTDETPDQGEDNRFISIGTNTWGTAGREAVMAMPIYEDVGYDCTSGSLADCSYFTGTTPGEFDALDGTANLVTSRFNPFDMQHNHLGALTLRNNKLKDESKSLFVDFDYALDSDYFTSVEFGVKWSDRAKSVHIQNLTTTNGQELYDPDDPDATVDPRGLGTIKLSDILSGEAFPFDNFAEDIQADRDAAFFGGWPMLSSERALELVGGKKSSDLAIRESNAGSRDIQTETTAAYVKVNFEAMDGRLTGNLGMRFIKDKSEATGLGGIDFIRPPQMIDPYDLLVTRQLGNMDLPACPDAAMGQYLGNNDVRGIPANDDQLRDCWAWQVTHAFNRTDEGTFPYDNETGEWLVKGADGQTGPDVNRIFFADYTNGIPVITQNNELPAQVFDNDGNLVDTNAGLWLRFGSAGQIWPWIDRTTTFTTPLFDDIGEQVRRRTALVTNTGENDMVLPSLNLNYAINEEMIGRFAISRTMTRPRFDSLNPRTQLTENQWGASYGSAGNTQLKPLESTNVDFSYEWYFNSSSMVSVALFFKKMENFEQSVLIPYHYKNVKEDYNLESADLLLDFDPNRAPGDEDNCMPLRYSAGWISQWTLECDVVNVNTVRNGAGADIRGLEFGYTQNYDFLPVLFI
ncbi:TonB-dependent receptor plug domain-containing protein [Paraglaciecola aquimarina]|uniref:TonB-dependent receptor plug domain-containing protein n=1 Tax=Paraglaciecola aquimarina TaxID=1235557 RepID=A0ABU3T220_9ALTE|nr:TonB-dependent receptor [Paraglaciecola aquimarina]MDU0356311.1 TonB-dependent receptor plug domain-containing protein [Paraglaciecola aquimarina]